MYIEIVLNSKYLTDAENEWLNDCSIEFEWNCPILPRKGEYLNLHSILTESDKLHLEQLSTGIAMISWKIRLISWYNSGVSLVPIIFLKGE
jgi:hypothetical protein